MHLHRKALYRTAAGNLYQYVGVCRSLFGDALTFRLVKRTTGLLPRQYITRNVNELHSPGHWMRGIKLVGKNYAHKTQ